MDKLRRFLETAFPLYSTEQAFKYIYQNNCPISSVDPAAGEFQHFFNPDENERNAVFFQEFQHLVNSIRKNIRPNEKIYFQPNRNLSVLRQPRYMPSVLHDHELFFEIQYILHGDAEEWIDHVNYSLHRGDFLIISPGTEHTPFVSNDETIMINILIQTSALQEVFTKICTEFDMISAFISRFVNHTVCHPVLICHTGDSLLCAHEIIDMLEISKQNQPYADQIIYTKLQLLFLYILRDHRESFYLGKKLPGAKENFIDIISYIQNNYAHITLPELAKNFNYTESYMSNLIRKNYGRTFQQLLQDIKLQKATELLTSTHMNISEIIRSLGYTENSYFFKIFKKKYGMTPAQYQKNFPIRKAAL